MISLFKMTLIIMALLGSSLCSEAQKSGKKKHVVKKVQPKPVIKKQSVVVAVSTKCPCNFPSISFDLKDPKITDKAKDILNAISETILQNPESVITINGSSLSTKSDVNSCYQKMDRIRMYLSEQKGIRMERINTECNFVEDLRKTMIVSLRCEIARQ